MNKAQLIGYVGDKPVIKDCKNGACMAKLRLATQIPFKKDNNQVIFVTTWHAVVFWGEKRVKAVSDLMIKGSHVFVEGAVEYQTFEDRNGRTRYVTRINAQPVYEPGCLNISYLYK